jgi:ABC-2 type transport system permease protein
MRQLLALIKKEFLQIRRDPRTLGIVLFAPLIMLVLYGYAINFDIKHIRIVVCDQDRSTASRDLVRGFTASEYFDIVGYEADPERLIEYLDAGKARAVFWIPSGFGARLTAGDGAVVFSGIDGSDSNTATIALGYLTAYIRAYSTRVSLERLQVPGRNRLVRRIIPFSVAERIWYNPELQSTHYIVPGLISTLLMMMVSLLTAMAITGEKERNTFEQLVASPMRPWQLILGKIIPYALVSFMGVLLIIPAAIFWFQVPFRGSLAVLFLFIFVFLTAVLGIGLLFSTIARTQQQAMFMVMSATAIPAILLSGFVFPIESMPPFLRFLTYFVPARFFLVALRGIFLKGVGLEVLWPQIGILAGFAALLMGAAVVKFRKRLD